ncbi:uncharacterized protein LOC144009796 [Festucalex cinctus]
MLTPEKSGAQPSTSAQMTFHRTMMTTMGPMQDSLGQSSKEREDRAHSNVRPLVLQQSKLLLIGHKVTLLTVSRTKNVHQPIHPRKKDPKDSGWLEVDEFGWQPTIFPFAAKPGPRDAAAELNSHLPATSWSSSSRMNFSSTSFIIQTSTQISSCRSRLTKTVVISISLSTLTSVHHEGPPPAKRGPVQAHPPGSELISCSIAWQMTPRTAP